MIYNPTEILESERKSYYVEFPHSMSFKDVKEWYGFGHLYEMGKYLRHSFYMNIREMFIWECTENIYPYFFGTEV